VEHLPRQQGEPTVPVGEIGRHVTPGIVVLGLRDPFPGVVPLAEAARERDRRPPGLLGGLPGQRPSEQGGEQVPLGLRVGPVLVARERPVAGVTFLHLEVKIRVDAAPLAVLVAQHRHLPPVRSLVVVAADDRAGLDRLVVPAFSLVPGVVRAVRDRRLRVVDGDRGQRVLGEGRQVVDRSLEDAGVEIEGVVELLAVPDDLVRRVERPGGDPDVGTACVHEVANDVLVAGQLVPVPPGPAPGKQHGVVAGPVEIEPVDLLVTDRQGLVAGVLDGARGSDEEARIGPTLVALVVGATGRVDRHAPAG